uniref:HU family DNA-binding protein n=1 Tax=Prevotella sp. TaxID=59823 RepID=UPI0040273A7E
MSSKYPVLSEALTKRYALPEADADKFVAQMFDVLLKAVEQEGVVKVKGLGTFKLTPVGARESVDVNTGERIVIDSRNKITFVPDVVLRDRVNSPFAQFETVVLNDGVEFSSLDEKPEAEEEAEENDENETAEENEAAEEEETADEENEAPAEDKAPAEDEAPAEGSIKEEAQAEDKAPADGSNKEEAQTPIHVVADKLTDASDKLSSASSKLSDVSDKLSSASERLSDSSKQLSTASSQAADGSGNKQLRDALSIANDLRKQVFDMKQQSFVYTNENRKLKNANFVLTKRVRRMRLWLWVLALCVVMLLATIGAGCFYLASEPTPIMLQERSAFEPEQDSLAATKNQTAPTDASQATAPQA